MPRIIGKGLDAVLVADGADSPEADGRREAVRQILTGFWLHGTPSRGWNNCLWEALRALSPEAAECLANEGESVAYERFAREDSEDSADTSAGVDGVETP